MACSARNLNLAELDALLLMRDPEGARITDLEERLRKTFKSLFALSTEDSVFDRLEKESVRQELVSADLTDLEDMFLLNGMPRDTNTEFDILHQDTDGRENIDSKTPVSEDVFGLSVKRKKAVLAMMEETTIALDHDLLAAYIQDKKTKQGLDKFATDKMQAKVLLSCLLVLCDEEVTRDQDVLKSALAYCGQYFGKHFENPTYEHCDSETRLEVGLLLVKLLRSSSLLDRWAANSAFFMTSNLFSNVKLPSLLLDWLNDSTLRERLDEDQRQWISRANAEPVKIMFAGMATAHAKRWLTMRDSDAFYNIEFVNAYLAKV